jgi:hypothetical protein
MAGLKLELDERAKQKLMEYLAVKISRRFLRGGFELSMNHRFLITTVYALISLFFPISRSCVGSGTPIGCPMDRPGFSPAVDDYISKHDILKTMMRFSLCPLSDYVGLY